MGNTWVRNIVVGFSLILFVTVPADFAWAQVPAKLLPPIEVEVVLERVYLDGEVSEELVKENIYSLESFWSKYDDWQLINMEERSVVFRKQVDDISPLLKANGYFGITEDGVLTIYYGRPEKLKIIQSFFQIDVGKLESTKHEQLKKGIPIKNKDRYVEVLETFKNYTIQDKQAN